MRRVISRVALVVALAGLSGGVLAAAPAVAAPEDFSAVLQISKTVQDATLAPGDTLSYTIAVECLSTDCIDATVTDVLPSRTPDPRRCSPRNFRSPCW